MIFKARCYLDCASQCGSRVPKFAGVEFCFSLLSMYWNTWSQLSLGVCLSSPPIPPHPCLSYLFVMASSLHLAVGSLFCQSSSHFLHYLYRNRCYLGISMGRGELSFLLVHHIPGSLKIIFIGFRTSVHKVS